MRGPRTIIFSFLLFFVTYIGCDNKHIAVELIGAIIPSGVVSDKPKACVTISRNDLQEELVGNWPRLLESRTPQWKTARPFGKLESNGKAEFTIVLENYVAHILSPSSKSVVAQGQFTCKESDLDVVQNIEIKSISDAKYSAQIFVKCFAEDFKETLKHKKLFFVRHGESTWNLAQKKMRIFTLLTSRDNDLSLAGKDQALLACSKISCPVLSEHEIEFTDADIVYASPLTRATQTAILALKSILPRTGLVFDASLREKRNFGGKDSSGSLTTSNIQKEICDHLADGLKAEDTSGMKDYCDGIAMDTSMIHAKWWQNSAEPVENVRQRINNFLMKVRYSKQEKVIFVGHSHYFREMCILHLDASPITVASETSIDKVDNPNLPFTQKIVRNLGVVYIDFDPAQEQKFASVELLFDSQLL